MKRRGRRCPFGLSGPILNLFVEGLRISVQHHFSKGDLEPEGFSRPRELREPGIECEEGLIPRL